MIGGQAFCDQNAIFLIQVARAAGGRLILQPQRMGVAADQFAQRLAIIGQFGLRQ